ncbi:hypothetical protein TNCV_30661 [Trichonephila clavipes]|nr:hypothetical protein TNCV_30661 [Trichonephila clavipes]
MGGRGRHLSMSAQFQRRSADLCRFHEQFRVQAEEDVGKSIKDRKVLIPPLQTQSFRNPHSQKSQGFSREREGHASGKYLDYHDYCQS